MMASNGLLMIRATKRLEREGPGQTQGKAPGEYLKLAYESKMMCKYN